MESCPRLRSPNLHSFRHLRGPNGTWKSVLLLQHMEPWDVKSWSLRTVTLRSRIHWEESPTEPTSGAEAPVSTSGARYLEGRLLL